MRRVDDIHMATFTCSCGGTYGYTAHSLPYLHQWLADHREHDTSKRELIITPALQQSMGWSDEQVKMDVELYEKLP